MMILSFIKRIIYVDGKRRAVKPMKANPEHPPSLSVMKCPFPIRSSGKSHGQAGLARHTLECYIGSNGNQGEEEQAIKKR